MPRYRKKPVEIDAFRMVTGAEMPAWFVEALADGRIEPLTPSTEPNVWWRDGVAIKTLEGQMTGNLGDWVIRGVAGELYPCRNDVFVLSYEAVG